MLLPSPAAAQWYRTYEEAKSVVQTAQKSRARADWQRAERLLNQAIAEARKENVSPGRVLQEGMYIDHFVPDYYLGVVYEATGELQNAADAYTRAEAIGATTREREFRDIDTRKNRVALALASQNGRQEAASPAPNASPDDTTAQQQASSPVPYGGKGGSPAPSPRAENEVSQQPAPLGVPSRQPVEDSKAAGAGDSNGYIAERLPRGGQFDANVAEVGKGLQGVTVPRLVGLNVSQARQVLEKARLRINAKGVNSDRQPNTVVAQTPQAGVRVRAGSVIDLSYSASLAVPAGPDPEQVAVRAYFAGDYAAAIRTIDALISEKSARTISSRVQFYLACSYAAQSILASSDRDRLLTAARAAYDRAATDERRFARDRTYISPRVLRLLEPRAAEGY
jgi:tetratricopeptide (TPR) repeat protein